MLETVVSWSALVVAGVPLAFASAAALSVVCRARAGLWGALLAWGFVLATGWRTEIVVDAPALWVLMAAATAGAVVPLVRRA